MTRRKRSLVPAIFLLVLVCIATLGAVAQSSQPGNAVPSNGNLYVNANSGNNNNTGSIESPLLTLDEAAKRINSAKGKGAVTIYIAKGVYGLTKTVDFNAVDWEFTNENRLTIRAEVLPGDSNWNPADMPILISTMPFSVEKNRNGEITGGQNFGILIQESHVTVQGLRVLGEPVHENPTRGMLIRNYPIVWEGKGLEDLRVTQCLFIGSKYAIPNHLAILANGKALEVAHCIFYGVKDAVVMWNNPSSNSSMHHNLILDSYGGVVWTWSATADFKFYNNVVSNGNVLWILDKEEKLSYNMENSLIVGYQSLVNKGGGPQDFGKIASPGKVKIHQSVILKKKGRLEIIEDQTNKMYLHLKPGTLGTNLDAGLFIR